MNDNDYDTHNPDNTPEDPTMEWNGEYPDNNPTWTENEDGSGQWSDGWNGECPGQDDPANYEACGDDYDTEDDSWSDGDSLASAGWGMDEDYTGGCDV